MSATASMVGEVPSTMSTVIDADRVGALIQWFPAPVKACTTATVRVVPTVATAYAWETLAPLAPSPSPKVHVIAPGVHTPLVLTAVKGCEVP